MPVVDEGVTVAVNVTFVPGFTLVADGEIVIVVGVRAQTCARLYASTDPKPVTSSYPVPALKPYWNGVAVGQPVVPAVHGTMLFPVVTSWNGLGELPGNE